MGYRLHVAKEYTVKYGSVATFNYKEMEFEFFIHEFSMDVYFVGDGVYEITIDSWNRAIDKLRKALNTYNETGEVTLDESEFDAVTNLMGDMGIDDGDYATMFDNLIHIMLEFSQEADIRDGYLHFAFV